jgi:hypothetical protein
MKNMDCVRVCVCEREREREREIVCVYLDILTYIDRYANGYVE